MSKEYIAWIDVEATGVEIDAKLLSVAAIVTDVNLNIVSDEYEAVIWYSDEDITDMYNQADPFVQDMHNKTGLWRDLMTGAFLEDVDIALSEFLKNITVVPRQMRLGGNSVRLDLNQLEQWLPKTYAHLHYSPVDMSTMSFIMRRWEGIDPYRGKTGTHNALQDIRESIDEARYYKEILDEAMMLRKASKK